MSDATLVCLTILSCPIDFLYSDNDNVLTGTMTMNIETCKNFAV